MGEKLDSYEKSPAQEITSQKLDDFSFSCLSETTDGLKNFPQKTLEAYIYEKENIEDILYIFKFISNTDFYLNILDREAANFSKLDQEQKIEVKRLAELFYSFLSDSPILYENTPVNVGEEGLFIAYVNASKKRLDISWKDEKKNNHLFQKLLEKVRATSTDYPDSLRSYGFFEIQERDMIDINFYGDCGNKYLGYAPGYLKNFEQEFIEYFEESLGREDIKIQF